MVMVRETEQKPAVTETHIELRVLPSSSEPSKVEGTIHLRDTRTDSPVGAGFSTPQEIGAAWTWAWKIARDRAVDVIWVNDEKGLFPKSKRPNPA